MGAREPDEPRISIIVPLKDEAESIDALLDEIRGTMDGVGAPYEVILADDGSVDGTWERCRAAAGGDSRIVALRFGANRGQTAALSAGFDYSRGDVIVPMDGDGQNDPADIPRLLAKLEEGFDVVSGWRRNRRDAALTRVWPSRIANRLISLVGRVRLHDYGCTLKAYRRDVVKDVRLFGEMHRFIPIYASWEGARVAELEVNHRPRRFGRSKYGLMRTVKVVLDLIVIKFLADFLAKPIYLFGGVGLAFLGFGALAGSHTLYLKLALGKSFIDTPMPLLTIFLLALGINAILIGLLAELLSRAYFEIQEKTTYRVREIIRKTSAGANSIGPHD